jgi:eukaryotic-like serine/threonine-protein kinase
MAGAIVTSPPLLAVFGPEGELAEMQTCLGCGQTLEPNATHCSGCGAAVAKVEPTVVRGTTILDGKYAVERELGRGGMGTVLLARDLELERMVAVKVLSPALKDQPEIITRFEREAKMLARLEHPNIVPIYAVGRHDDLPFIVMKNLEGETLTAYVSARGRLDPQEVLIIARQLCGGLAFLHSRGIIHRDIKPGNIFIAPDGHVTILDLGVAHDANQQMTRTGLLIGTPRYMSPEQILKGTGGLDHRSDIYALGTVLFEMLTGAPVFDAESDFGVMRAHTDEQPPDIAQFVPDLPPELNAALQLALAKDRDARFQSASELYQALETALLPTHAGLREVPVGGFISRPPMPMPRVPSGVGGTAGRPRTPAPVQEAQPFDATYTPARPRTIPPRSIPPGGAAPPQHPAAAAPDKTPPPGERPALEARAGTKKTGLLIPVAVVFVLVAVAGGGYFALRTSAPTPAPLPVAAAEVEVPEPIVRVEPAAPPEPAPAPAEPPAAEPPAPEPPVAEARPAPTPPRAPARPRPPARTEPASAEAAAKASPTAPVEIRVVTTFAGKASWAWLDVNGLRQGTTPAILKLAPGTHALRLTRPGYKTIEQSLEVRPGKPARVALELQQ